MTDVLKYLFKSFVLLRDLVGYLIPGLSFIALVYPDWTLGFIKSSPELFPVLALLLAAYAVAQVLAAAGYTLLRQLHPPKETAAERYKRSVDITYYETTYPDLFIQADRAETILMVRIGLSVALFCGGLFHLGLIAVGYDARDWLALFGWTVCLAAGVLQFWNCFAGDDYVRNLDKAAVEAAQKAEARDVGKPSD